MMGTRSWLRQRSRLRWFIEKWIRCKMGFDEKNDWQLLIFYNGLGFVWWSQEIYWKPIRLEDPCFDWKITWLTLRMENNLEMTGFDWFWLEIDWDSAPSSRAYILLVASPFVLISLVIFTYSRILILDYSIQLLAIRGMSELQWSVVNDSRWCKYPPP